jgi:hypothetical protein
MNHKESKQAIRNYVRTLDDYRLGVLATVAADGQLFFSDRCYCIRGICGGGTVKGYDGEDSYLAVRAERGMYYLGWSGESWTGDNFARNHVISAICRAEQKRRLKIEEGEGENEGRSDRMRTRGYSEFPAPF